MSKAQRLGRKEREARKGFVAAFVEAHRLADNASRICERSPLRSSSDVTGLKAASGAGFVEARGRTRETDKAFLRR